MKPFYTSPRILLLVAAFLFAVLTYGMVGIAVEIFGA